MPRPLAELEAESVAFIVCQAAGIDSGEYRFGYRTGDLVGRRRRGPYRPADERPAHPARGGDDPRCGRRRGRGVPRKPSGPVAAPPGGGHGDASRGSAKRGRCGDARDSSPMHRPPHRPGTDRDRPHVAGAGERPPACRSPPCRGSQAPFGAVTPRDALAKPGEVSDRSGPKVVTVSCSFTPSTCPQSPTPPLAQAPGDDYDVRVRR
jgi:hypothetical protein